EGLGRVFFVPQDPEGEPVDPVPVAAHQVVERPVVAGLSQPHQGCVGLVLVGDLQAGLPGLAAATDPRAARSNTVSPASTVMIGRARWSSAGGRRWRSWLHTTRSATAPGASRPSRGHPPASRAGASV